MIVVMIIGILAAIAYPSYMQYLVRTNRAAAQQFMLEVTSRQTQHLLDARQYAGDLSTLGLTSVPAEVSDNYTISIINLDNAASPPFYQVQAAPRAGSVQAGEATLKLSSTGVKEPASEW